MKNKHLQNFKFRKKKMVRRSEIIAITQVITGCEQVKYDCFKSQNLMIISGHIR